jgi:MoaA/NifB/PqqE/SkfB family radical SAM enzyme
MYNFEEITQVHLEVSEACNAACPMCARFTNYGGEYSPYLTNTIMNLDKFKLIFDINFVQQLKCINFCGTMGDPITSKDLLKQIAYLVEINPSIKINIDTNGGLRSKNWWQELGKYFQKNIKVTFSIDGLSDTNHIYRRNVNWDKLEKNFKSFISSGGNAEWQFIKFKHNEHQAEEARRLAKEWGFRTFQLKNSNRFNLQIDGTYNYPVKNLGSLDTNYYLEPPSNFVPLRYEEFDLDTIEIDCKVKKSKEIFISAASGIYPCCYLYTDIKRSSYELEKITVSETQSIKDIFESGYFREIEKTWEIKSISQGRNRKCAITCGMKNLVTSQKFDCI